MATVTPISGFEGLYLAHEFGFIISCAKTWKGGINGNIVRSKMQTCLKGSVDKYGYVKVVLMKDGKAHYRTVHRLIAQTFIENPEGLPQVNHRDGNKLNNAASNLEWATDIGNKKHAWETGLCKATPQPKGEKNPKSKLTDLQAEQIRHSVKSCRNLASEYGVHHSIIAGIKKGKRYRK